MLKIVCLINNLFRYVDVKINTEYFQEYLEQKKNKTEEEKLALKESKRIGGKLLAVILVFAALFASFGIGFAIAHYRYQMEIQESVIGGLIALLPMGTLGIIVIINLASYPQRHWNAYINKVTKIMNDNGRGMRGLMDEDFYKDFLKLKKRFSRDGQNIDQMIADMEVGSYSGLIFKNILVSVITFAVVVGISTLIAFNMDSDETPKYQRDAVVKEHYQKEEILEQIKEDGEGSMIYYIEQETEVKGEERVLYYYCTEKSKTVTKLMTKVNKDNSYSIHYKTVTSDETPESIMQSDEVKKLK